MHECEIFDLLESHDFYTIKPQMGRRLRDGNKKFKSFSFWLLFRSVLGEVFELAYNEHALKKCDKQKSDIMGCKIESTANTGSANVLSIMALCLC